MVTQLTDDLYWLERCTSVDGRHLHVSAYLYVTEAGNILIDSGPHGDESIAAEVDQLTDGDGVDTVLFTHSSLPHTGNAAAFHADGARVISSTSLLAEMDMGYAEEWRIDEQPTIHGRTFSFVKPVFSDHIFSQWIFDHEEGVLFPSETFGNYHDPGDCAHVWASDAVPIPEDDIRAYCQDRLPGMKCIRPELLEEGLRARLETYDVSLVAPSHGTPIESDHVDAYVERLITVATRFSQDWLYHRMND